MRRYEQWDSELQTDFLFYKTLEVLIFAERHIHFVVTHPDHGQLVTLLFFRGGYGSFAPLAG